MARGSWWRRAMRERIDFSRCGCVACGIVVASRVRGVIALLAGGVAASLPWRCGHRGWAVWPLRRWGSVAALAVGGVAASLWGGVVALPAGGVAALPRAFLLGSARGSGRLGRQG
eukprot:14109783-Alexandrium_andersonii.AAC.1